MTKTLQKDHSRIDKDKHKQICFCKYHHSFYFTSSAVFCPHKK